MGIPIGYGVLIGRASSRKWALLITSGLTVIIVALVGLWVHAHWTGTDRASHAERVCAASAMLIAGASCLYVLTALTRREHRGWFAAVKEDTTAAKSFAWGVAVVAAVLTCPLQMTQWWIQETSKSARPFHVRIAPYDASNGKGLSGISYHVIDSPTRKEDSMLKLPKVATSVSTGENGIRVDFFGVAAQPFDVKVGYKGFKDKIVTLGEKSESELRVPLEPLTANEKKPETSGK